jgi:hypothetical protein
MKVGKMENVNSYFTIIKKGAVNLKLKNTVRLNTGLSFFRILEDWCQDKLASDRGEGTVRSMQAQRYRDR